MSTKKAKLVFTGRCKWSQFRTRPLSSQKASLNQTSFFFFFIVMDSVLYSRAKLRSRKYPWFGEDIIFSCYIRFIFARFIPGRGCGHPCIACVYGFFYCSIALRRPPKSGRDSSRPGDFWAPPRYLFGAFTAMGLKKMAIFFSHAGRLYESSWKKAAPWRSTHTWLPSACCFLGR